MLTGFSFKKVSSGAYRVCYQSDYDLKIGRMWTDIVNDMTLIDATLNEECPKRKDVERLKRIVKRARPVKMIAK